MFGEFVTSAESCLLLVGCRPVGSSAHQLQDGEQQLGAQQTWLPPGQQRGERRSHLPGQFPGKSGCSSRKHHLSALHGKARQSQDNRYEVLSPSFGLNV